ncbi:MAG TPA: AraC family transcriptional regulator [Arachidicoccus soli]|uniref:AraC family transcriptional regulator n=1 Tax=Arachidicoccus soli TaxID=2341117 RepID=A0A386HS75_9BACT|nr:AraC family transcriptional regulator [Arachidicoccus soli]AYD48715.1 AraC family transcriptional regulator [Arachidicoccus soli]HEU0226898.1 AraC family transcriptional regulator [Arachidicoccus soli]
MDIVKLTENECLEMGLELVFRKEYQVPGSIYSSINCYALDGDWMKQDNGMLAYNIQEKANDKKLNLRFCISGNRYCTNDNCTKCKIKSMGVCEESNNMVSLFEFSFTPNYLAQFLGNSKAKNKKEKVLSFEYKSTFTKLFPVCPQQRNTLSALLEGNYSGAMENIFINSKIHEVLLYSMECLVDEKGKEAFSCRFLADENGMDKIHLAKNILLENLDSPITIKELSKKVAINECYLKKGFKEVFGTTIFDFYQQQRMDHAKYLLYQKGLNVTDVAALLGYSSISHFSSAFKKQTGIKPCELLLR